MAGDGGFLRIPDSLGRDLDAGRCDNMAVDEFLPDHALQEIKDYQDSRSVVHAEDLRPISRSEAARRTMFDGEHLPKAPATRRVIPAPFRRDRVVGGRHGKEWRERSVREVRRGDIIPDIGLVVDLAERIRHEGEGKLGPIAVGTDIRITGAGGAERIFDAEASLQVFR